MTPFPFLQAPLFLYLFLTIPLLFFLWFSQKRFQQKDIPYLPLLLEVLQENPWYTFQLRYLKWFQFFFFLILFTLLILASTSPATGQKSWLPRYIQVIVDCSSSGAVLEKGGKRRLELLKQQVRQLLLHCKPEDSVLLIAVGRESRLLSPYTQNISELFKLVNALESQPVQADLASAFLLAQQLSRKGSLCFLFSDGAGSRSNFCESAPACFISHGTAETNLALVHAKLETLYHSSALHLQIKNYSETPQSFRLLLQQGEKMLHAATYSLKAQELWNKILKIHVEDETPLQIRLESPEDAFEFDNQTTLFLKKKPRILFLSSPEPFLPALELLFNAFRGKETARIFPEHLSLYPEPEDIFIQEGGELLSLPPQGTLVLFGTSLKPLEEDSYKKEVEAWNWDKTHPLLDYCSFEWLYIKKMKKKIEAGDGLKGKALLWGRLGEVLLEEYSQENCRIFYFPFTLKDSNFTELAVFPLFLANLLSLASQTNSLVQDFIYPQNLSFTGNSETQLFSEDRPSEPPIVLAPEEESPVLWPGVYRVHASKNSKESSYFISYHPFSPVFSSIKPKPGRTFRPGRWFNKTAPDFYEYRFFLVFLALILLCLEIYFILGKAFLYGI